MNLREHFEKLHPVPFGVVFADESYVPDNPFLSAEDWAIVRRLAETQNSIWQGFRSGHAAGLEDAAKECERPTADGTMYVHYGVRQAAAAIRELKEPK